MSAEHKRLGREAATRVFDGLSDDELNVDSYNEACKAFKAGFEEQWDRILGDLQEDEG